MQNLKKFFPEHLKVSKLGLRWDPLIQSRKCVILKFTVSWHWRVMQNLERNWLVVSKLTWGICQILTWALKSLKNFHFNGLPLSKVYIVWARKGQRSYLSWHWRVMQNLERNWVVVSNLTWGICQILTRTLESLKNFHFNGLFLIKVYNVWAKKVQRRHVW